jgi:NADH-quinone oxidoreductase subunit C
VAEDSVVPRILDLLPESVLALEKSFGDLVLVLKREGVLAAFQALRESPFDFTALLDATCVDFVSSEKRFEMVYHLYAIHRGERLRVKVSLPADDPSVDSLAGLWKNANWLEREIYDMFGVEFKGHPDLRRILMYEGFKGHPLRKSYPWRRRQPRIPMEGQ